MRVFFWKGCLSPLLGEVLDCDYQPDRTKYAFKWENSTQAYRSLMFLGCKFYLLSSTLIQTPITLRELLTYDWVGLVNPG